MATISPLFFCKTEGSNTNAKRNFAVFGLRDLKEPDSKYLLQTNLTKQYLKLIGQIILTPIWLKEI